MSTIPYVENTAWADDSGGATPITAAKLNTLEQGITDAQLMPAVRVYNNANISVSNGTLTALTFNSERFDTVGGAASTQHSTSANTSRLTCLYAGKYQISGTVQWATSTSGYRLLIVRLNGSTEVARGLVVPEGTGGSAFATISTLYDLAVNDYVELVVYQTSGGSLSVTSTGNISPEFMMVRVA